MKRLLPLTAFFAPNEAFTGISFDDEIAGVLENFLFEGPVLLTCEELLEMTGKHVESMNGEKWLVSKNDKGFPCFDTIEVNGSMQKACVTKCEVLGRNGVVQEIDKLLIHNALERAPTLSPTLSLDSSSNSTIAPSDPVANITDQPVETPTLSPTGPNATMPPTSGPAPNATEAPDDTNSTAPPDGTPDSMTNATTSPSTSFHPSDAPSMVPSLSPTQTANVFAKPTVPPTTETAYARNVIVYLQGMTELLSSPQRIAFIDACQKYLDENEQDETAVIAFVDQELGQSSRRRHHRLLQTASVAVETRITSRVHEIPGAKMVQLIKADSTDLVDALVAEDATFQNVQDVQVENATAPTLSPIAPPTARPTISPTAVPTAPPSTAPAKKKNTGKKALLSVGIILLIVSVVAAIYFSIRVHRMITDPEKTGWQDQVVDEEEEYEDFVLGDAGNMS